MNQQQFDGLTIEERELILERRDRLAREKAISHPGILANAVRSDVHKALWMTHARQLVIGNRALLFNIKALSARVLKWSIAQGITKHNGKPYSRSTIYQHISVERAKLIAEESNA